MKNVIRLLPVLLLLAMVSCKRSFLDTTPQGELTPDQLQTQDGVEGLLTGAYGLLNGNVNGTWGNYASAPSQWLFGEVAADDAHKGSNNGDQPNMNDIELHKPISTNDNLSVLWQRCYEGIARCNNTLRTLEALQSGSGVKFTDQRAKEIRGEARLLRGHYYFFLKRVFMNVPFIDEKMSTAEAAQAQNSTDVYPKIQEDLQFAIDNLPATKPKGEVGRVDKTVAQAYLGKVLLYLKKYPEALALFNPIIAGKPDITTIPFTDNFDVTKENGPESIFAVQHAINPDGSGDNANIGDMLAGMYGNAPVNCCGFFQPSFDLVNSYRVDAAGLPLLDNSYRTNPYKSDFGLTGTAKTNYTPPTTLVIDPRLDYTVGRRGVPFRDWGPMAGDDWIRDPAYAGPFIALKQTIEKSQFASNAVAGALQITALNVNLIRLADVYLMAAECSIETSDLPRALLLVNKIRTRAGNLPAKLIGGTPAAVYKVGTYPAFPSADYARSAVRFERRLELALEGHRFFDLSRWGIAKETIESYSSFEGSILSSYAGIVFKPTNLYYPIPQEQLDRSPGVLKQNDGY